MSQRTSPPGSPAPEIPAQLAVWQANPSATPERTQAIRALHVLAEAGDAPPDNSESAPPLPEHLRIRWEETYGREAGNESGLALPDHFFAAVRRWLSFKPIAWAWAGGGGLAAALLAVAFLQHQRPETADPGAVITRGHQPAAGIELVAPIYVIKTAAPVDPLLAKLREAFPARSIITLENRTGLPVGARIVIEASPDMTQHPDAAVNAVETLDEAAAAASP